MEFLDYIHSRAVFVRRVQRLAAILGNALPPNASLLDVGCGDGSIASALIKIRPDVNVRGIDVLVRSDTKIPVSRYDGVTLPFGAASFDVVSFVDVLHHTDDPAHLLLEARRVARKCIVIKDHLKDGFMAGPTLRLMDWIGNSRHGVRLPYNYWSGKDWHDAFASLGLAVSYWNESLRLYPVPASLLFDRRLHFFATLQQSEV